MASEIVDCEEFSEVSVRLSALMRDGELVIDPRVASKGYLSAAFKSGQVILRSTKFVGLIPLTPDLAVRIRPRATINNLSLMLVRSQKAPTAITGFAAGYTPKFVRTDNVEKLFGPSLVQQSEGIAVRGLVKRYERPLNNAPWRGRFLAAETVRLHAAKGIRYRHEFDQSVLTDRTIDNLAIQEALRLVVGWYARKEPKSAVLRAAGHALASFGNIPRWQVERSELVHRLGRLLSGQASIRPDYADALWSAYALLGSTIPNLEHKGKLALDSLIVNVSEVFEAYVRRELSDRLVREGFDVYDGWKKPHQFFTDNESFSVHPDIIIVRDGKVVAILDAKYKPNISEQDRYEVVSFMDAIGVSVGGFVSPQSETEGSSFLGTTASGKRLHTFRFRLDALDPAAEADNFTENVRKMLQGRSDFIQ